MADDLQAQLDDLRTARNSGVLRIRHGEVWTEYRSLDEVNRAIAALEAQLGQAPKSFNIAVRSSKGW